jgi:hypothetical protein
MICQSKNGKYRVEVGPDGGVKVKHGDRLSNYSAAIYNNYWNIRTFARRAPRGNLVPIRDVNLIYAGETLYHMPTLQEYVKGVGGGGRVRVATFQKPTVIVAKNPRETHLYFDGETIYGQAVGPMTDGQKRNFILDHVKGEYKLRGEQAEFVKRCCERIHKLAEYAEIAEVLADYLPKGLVEQIPEGVLAALETAEEIGIFAGLSVVGAFAFGVIATIQTVNAWSFGQRLIGLRAVAYGITSWAFEDPAPSPPSWISANMISSSSQKPAVADSPGGSVVAKAKALEAENAKASLQAWKDACESARREMDKKTRHAHADIDKIQATWRYLGYGSRQKLSRLVMKYLEERYLKTKIPGLPPYEQASVHMAFWSPDPNYPN